jgi:hypothetical protein
MEMGHKDGLEVTEDFLHAALTVMAVQLTQRALPAVQHQCSVSPEIQTVGVWKIKNVSIKT